MGSDKTKGKIQTPLEGKEFTTPIAESTREEKLQLTPSHEKRKDREKNQYQVSKEILNETIDEEAKMISLEIQKAMEETSRRAAGKGTATMNRVRKRKGFVGRTTKKNSRVER